MPVMVMLRSVSLKIVLSAILSGCISMFYVTAQSTFGTSQFISAERSKGDFTISAAGRSVPLLISSKDWAGVSRAIRDLQTDIGKVTSSSPELFTDTIPYSKEIIIAGTIGKSELIDQLILNGWTLRLTV